MAPVCMRAKLTTAAGCAAVALAPGTTTALVDIGRAYRTARARLAARGLGARPSFGRTGLKRLSVRGHPHHVSRRVWAAQSPRHLARLPRTAHHDREHSHAAQQGQVRCRCCQRDAISRFAACVLILPGLPLPLPRLCAQHRAQQRAPRASAGRCRHQGEAG